MLAFNRVRCLGMLRLAPFSRARVELCTNSTEFTARKYIKSEVGRLLLLL